jgi:Fe2+ transport system protein FeoA
MELETQSQFQSMDASLKRLTQIDYGVAVVIQELLHEGELRTRLLELGFLPGAEVRVVRAAPLGCPVEVDVGGARFSLRSRILESILVGPLT